MTRAEVQATSVQLSKALANELRAEIFTLLAETGAPMSPKEMALDLGARVGNVSHHCRQLVRYDCAELVDEQRRRGATEHFYRATRLPNIEAPEWELMDLPPRHAFSRHIAQKGIEDMSGAFEAGTMDARLDRALLRVPMSVDEEGWAELHAVYEEAFERVTGIKARSEERCAESGAKRISVSSLLFLFETP